MFNWVVARLSEPSTWLGLSFVVKNVGTVVAESMTGNFTGAIELGAGILGVVMKEGGGQ